LPSDAAAVAPVLHALDAGDRRTALDLLSQAHGREIYSYCRMMLGDPERARDALQTTFVQAYEALARFRRGSSPRTWLYSIARHRCLDQIRSTRRWERRATCLDGVSEVAAPDGGPEQALLHEEARRALDECLSRLAAHARDAVVQRHIEGLSYEEMAEVSREMPGTLRVRVARAMPLLRRCLEAAGVAP
jgi:RNA polymerase sigma-70 factor (ECF subfamily)